MNQGDRVLANGEKGTIVKVLSTRVQVKMDHNGRVFQFGLPAISELEEKS